MHENTRVFLISMTASFMATLIVLQLQKQGVITADYTDPYYMHGNPETPEYIDSNNDFGGLSADYPVFTGGTFLHPEFLPRTRTAKIQLRAPRREGYLRREE